MGGKTPKQTTQVNTVQLSPEQKEIFALAKPAITAAANTNPQIFDQSTIPGFTDLQLQGQNALTTAAGGTVNQLAGAGATANQFMLDPNMMLSPDQNPYVTAYGDTITRQMTQALTEQILPSIRSGSRMTGGAYSGGNTRQGIAEGLAVGRTAQGTGDALAKLYAEAYGSGLESLGRGLALNPQTIASQLTSGQVLDAVGTQQRALQQAQLEEQANNFYLQQQLPFMKAQDLMALVNGMPGASGVSSVTGAQPKSGGVMGGLGGAASGAALGSMIMPGIGTAVGAGLGGLLGLFG